MGKEAYNEPFNKEQKLFWKSLNSYANIEFRVIYVCTAVFVHHWWCNSANE